jgi:hypothetical protein
MVIRKQPFMRASAEDPFYKHIMENSFDDYWAEIAQGKPDLYSVCTAEFRQLLFQMLQFEPSQRLTMEQLKEHRWMMQGPSDSTATLELALRMSVVDLRMEIIMPKRKMEKQ